jgi:hypothetical protein
MQDNFPAIQKPRHTAHPTAKEARQMGKREDEKEARRQEYRRTLEKQSQKLSEEFEAHFEVPDSNYRVALYRRILHKAIMHFSRCAMREANYEYGYQMDRSSLEFAVTLINHQTKLALAAHKIETELAKSDRDDATFVRRRSRPQNSSKFWKQPHASQIERDDNDDDKHLYGPEGPYAHVRQSPLPGADEEGGSMP